MSGAKSCIVFLSLIFFVLIIVKPSAGMINGYKLPNRPYYLAAIYIYNPKTRERTAMCSATLISPTKALTSCYCANYALLVAQSYQEPFPYQAEVHFALGMTSLEPKAFRAQNANGSIYDVKITYGNIACPPGDNLLDTTNYPDDIALIDIGYLDLVKYTLEPVRIAVVDDPKPGNNDTFTVSWSSGTSCDLNVDIQRNAGQATIVDCGQTKIQLSECYDDLLCTKYPNNVQLTLGDTGGANVVVDDPRMDIQVGIVSRQRKTQPYGAGCTERGAAQINTRLAAYADWIKEMSPDARFTRIPLRNRNVM